MGASVPYGFDAKRTRRPSPPAGTPSTERDAAQHVAAQFERGVSEPYPSHDDRVQHWSESDRLAFLARVQRVNWR